MNALAGYCIADKSRFWTLNTRASDFRFMGVLLDFQAFVQKEMDLINNTWMIIIQDIRHTKEHTAVYSIELQELLIGARPNKIIWTLYKRRTNNWYLFHLISPSILDNMNTNKIFRPKIFFEGDVWLSCASFSFCLQFLCWVSNSWSLQALGLMRRDARGTSCLPWDLQWLRAHLRFFYLRTFSAKFN